MSNMVFVPAGEEGPSVVAESRINGTFAGWAPGNSFSLMNGQVWQQLSVGRLYRFAVVPRVTVVRGWDGEHTMRVQGVPGAARVRRVR